MTIAPGFLGGLLFAPLPWTLSWVTDIPSETVAGVASRQFQIHRGPLQIWVGLAKGVFVTTSRYTKMAHEYAERSHKRLRLIDGHELARLMVQHGIGVRGYRTLELKRLDADFLKN